MIQLPSKFVTHSFATVLFSLLLTGCKKDDPVEENQEEVITTVKLTFNPTGGGTSFTYQYRDIDGPGGVAPTQDEIMLPASTTYNVLVQLLNETQSPAEDITAEVEEESRAHRFYYQPSPSANIAVGNLNNDDDGIPLGTTSTWAAGAVATGSITVTLRHYPGNPPGKETGDLVTSSKSATDVEVTFVTKLQ